MLHVQLPIKSINYTEIDRKKQKKRERERERA